MYCKNCGNKLNDGDKFCVYCGSKTEVIENTQTAQSNTNTQIVNFNGLAIAGFILSIISFLLDAFCIISITGTTLSSVALYQIIKKQSAGRGLAIAGLILGVVSFVMNVRYLMIIFRIL
ncbi:MAG: DUF4190 domain-containing protein [Clostridia bacterium]|nr:DUF4190 domain-containing protein [Clostridia bacterium]